MNPTESIEHASLYFREGVSDKVYHVTIEEHGAGHVVNFAYGRRGSTLNTGTKTNVPVTLEKARAIMTKLMRSKLAKGYRFAEEDAPAYTPSTSKWEDSGIRCQLLNPVDEDRVGDLLDDHSHCLQEKFDGRRMMIRKSAGVVEAVNRRGLMISMPVVIREVIDSIPHDLVIDGEVVGECYHPFDLLEIDGHDYRQRRYIDRMAALLNTVPSEPGVIEPVDTWILPTDKRRVFDELKQGGREGVVFKEIAAPFSPGRPNSGGAQLKFKFVESASFVVGAANLRRSVRLGLYDGDKVVHAGNVTIPPNQPVPITGSVVDVRYLYAHPQSGKVCQPVFLRIRDDIPPEECGVDQLKYKG